MKNTKKIGMGGTGAVSLVMIVVVLTMSIMAMLVLTSARNDERLSSRSAAVIENSYQLYDNAERKLAELDEIAVVCKNEAKTQEEYLKLLEEKLPFTMEMDSESGLICWEETLTTQTIICKVTVLPFEESGNRLSWHTCQILSHTGDDSEWN